MLKHHQNVISVWIYSNFDNSMVYDFCAMNVCNYVLNINASDRSTIRPFTCWCYFPFQNAIKPMWLMIRINVCVCVYSSNFRLHFHSFTLVSSLRNGHKMKPVKSKRIFSQEKFTSPKLSLFIYLFGMRKVSSQKSTSILLSFSI